MIPCLSSLSAGICGQQQKTLSFDLNNIDKIEHFMPVVDFTLDEKVELFNKEKFKMTIAQRMRISPDEVVVLSVRPGSTKVLFTIKKEFYETQILTFLEDIVKLTPIANLIVQTVDSIAEFFKKVPLGQLIHDFPSLARGELDKIVAVQNPLLQNTKNWLTEHSKMAQEMVETALKKCTSDFVVVKSTLVYNPKLLEKFLHHTNQRNMKLLYHATKTENYDSILENGFSKNKIGTANDPGYYGQGFYFSSFPEYCLIYKKKNDWVENLVTLIVSWVNLGKQETVNKIIGGKEILVDSHYVQVNQWGQPYSGDEIKCDEYVVKDETRVLPTYIIYLKRVDKTIIWRDPKVENNENHQVYTMLREIKGNFNLYIEPDGEEALKLITTKKKECTLYLITNGNDDAEKFVATVQKNKIDKILVFCHDLKEHVKWASGFEGVYVTDRCDLVARFVYEIINGNPITLKNAKIMLQEYLSQHIV